MASSIQHIYCLDSQYAMARVAFGRKARSGVIDLDGNFILEPKYTLITGWGGRYMYVVDECNRQRVWDAEERVFLDDKLGKTITRVNRETFTFREGRRYGICDEAGNTLIPAQYYSIQAFGRDYVAVSRKGFLFLGPKGEVLFPETYDELIGMFIYSSCSVDNTHYTYDLIPARHGEDWFYVDRNGNRISEHTYTAIGPFTTDGYAIFKDGKGRRGIINKEEKVVVPARYDSLEWEGKNVLSYTVKGRIFLINPLGEKLLKHSIASWADYSRDCVCGKYSDHLALWRWSPDTGTFQRTDIKGFTPRSFRLAPTRDYVIITQYAHSIQHADSTLVQQDGKPLFERFYDWIDTSANPDRIFVKEGKKWFLLNAKEEILKEIEYPDLERV